MEKEEDLEIFLSLKKFENYKDFKDIMMINEIDFLQKDFRYSLANESEDSHL